MLKRLKSNKVSCNLGVYRSTIPIIDTEEHLDTLYDLYFLANKLCPVDLKDETMVEIQELARKYDLKHRLLAPELLILVIQDTL
jgi:hypothetical protein